MKTTVQKLKVITLILISSLIFFSCSKDNDKPSNKTPATPQVEGYGEFTISGDIERSGTFELTNSSYNFGFFDDRFILDFEVEEFVDGSSFPRGVHDFSFVSHFSSIGEEELPPVGKYDLTTDGHATGDYFRGTLTGDSYQFEDGSWTADIFDLDGSVIITNSEKDKVMGSFEFTGSEIRDGKEINIEASGKFNAKEDVW